MDIIRIKTVIWLFLVRVTTALEIDLVRYNQKTLTAGVYQSLQARSLLHCSTLCTIDPSCNSGDYNVDTAECRFSVTIGPSLIASMIGDANFVAYGKIDCGEPTVALNSYIDPGNTTAGSQRQYNCDVNYAPTLASDVSSMVVTCLSSGNWTSIDFQCVIDCGAPSPITGVSVGAGATIEGSQLVLECEAGYLPENSGITSDIIECQATGTWNGYHTDFRCLKECSSPPSVLNAEITPSAAAYMEGDVTTYACSSGYGAKAGSDNGIITCEADGTWSSSTLTCLVDCGEPGSKTKAGISAGSNLEGDTRTYSCIAGYDAAAGSDSGHVTCQSDGSWSTSTLSCVVDCGTPSLITGVSFGAGSTIKDSELVLQCEAEYQPQNSAVTSDTIKCTGAGTWTGYDAAFRCLRDCGAPASKTNAVISSGGNLEGDTRTYSCNTGYAAASGYDTNEVTCQSNGAWSTSTFACERDCGEPSSKTNAALSPGNNLEGNTRTYSCNAGYAAAPGSGTGDVTCQSTGAWTTSTLNCVRDCGNPSSKSNADTSSGGTLVGDTRTYTCTSSYGPASGSDDGVIMCQAGGSWTTSTLTCAAQVTVSQWVASVPAYSSQWTEDHGYDVSQLIGANDVYPTYGDEAGAWCSEDGSSNDYLELQFTQAVYMTTLDVYETDHAGGTKRILYRDTDGNWHTVFQTSNIQNLNYARIFSLSFAITSTMTNYVRLELDCSNWMQIDAVEMTGIKYGS